MGSDLPPPPGGSAGTGIPGQLRAQGLRLGYQMCLPRARCGTAVYKGGCVFSVGSSCLLEWVVPALWLCLSCHDVCLLAHPRRPSGLCLPGPFLPDLVLPFFLQDGELRSSHCPSA